MYNIRMSIRGISRKQARAVEILLNDPRKSKAQAIREAGYGESIARQPHKVFGSPAVISEMEKRGYDELGISLSPRSSSDEMAQEPSSPDLFKFLVGNIEDLKQRLAEIPEPKRQSSHGYIPSGDGKDIFSSSPEQRESVRETQTLSSM